MLSARFRRRRAQVLLGQRFMAWSDSDGALETTATTDLAHGLERMSELALSRKPHRLQVWLSGGLCALATLPVIQGVRSEAEALLALRSRRPARSDHLEGAEVRLFDWSQTASIWHSCAVEGGLLPDLDRRFGARIESVRPWTSLYTAKQPVSAGKRASAVEDTGARVLVASDSEAAVVIRWADGDEPSAIQTFPLAGTGACDRLLSRLGASGQLSGRYLHCSLDISPSTQIAAQGMQAAFAFEPFVSRSDIEVLDEV